MKFVTNTYQLHSNSGGAWNTGSTDNFNLTNADVVLNAGVSNSANNSDAGFTVASTTGNTLTINGNITTNNNRTLYGAINSGTLTLNNTVSVGTTNSGFFVDLNGGTLNINSTGAIANTASIGGLGNRAGFVISLRNGGVLRKY